MSEWLWTQNGGGQKHVNLLLSSAIAENENPTSARSESKFYEIYQTGAKSDRCKKVLKVLNVLNFSYISKY